MQDFKESIELELAQVQVDYLKNCIQQMKSVMSSRDVDDFNEACERYEDQLSIVSGPIDELVFYKGYYLELLEIFTLAMEDCGESEFVEVKDDELVEEELPFN